jgi:hypothetical protein
MIGVGWQSRPIQIQEMTDIIDRLVAACATGRGSRKLIKSKGGLVIACQVFGFSRHRLAIVANTVVFAAVADKRIRNIWGK